MYIYIAKLLAPPLRDGREVEEQVAVWEEGSADPRQASQEASVSRTRGGEAASGEAGIFSGLRRNGFAWHGRWLVPAALPHTTEANEQKKKKIEANTKSDPPLRASGGPQRFVGFKLGNFVPLFYV